MIIYSVQVTCIIYSSAATRVVKLLQEASISYFVCMSTVLSICHDLSSILSGELGCEGVFKGFDEGGGERVVKGEVNGYLNNCYFLYII